MNKCICCGAWAPEKRQFCPNCETWGMAPDAILPDGTALYLKPTSKNINASIQMALYEQLLDYKRAIQSDD